MIAGVRSPDRSPREHPLLSSIRHLARRMFLRRGRGVDRQLRDVLDNLDEPVAVLSPDGTVRFVNAAYRTMLGLLRLARLCLTDSGGLQKEAYVLGTPCVTLRDSTEWSETVTAGWNRLAGADPDRIEGVARDFVPPASRPQLYGDGHAASRIADAALGA